MGEVYSAYDPDLDRRVALKLLRRSERTRAGQERARQRLLREAQAAARVSHPNVVAVHDVGVVAGQPFVAMELVRGQTLGSWLTEGVSAEGRPAQEGPAAKPAAEEDAATGDVADRDGADRDAADRDGADRDAADRDVADRPNAEAAPGSIPRRNWREILHAFLEAGKGLEAAHQAGLVHRDFKPGNVMVAEDGRVCVLDFGLARGHTDDTPEPADDMSARDEQSSGNDALDDGEDSDIEAPYAGHNVLWNRSLTRTDRPFGTPAYMAPEQRRRGETSARSDQYSFCLCLYEALYGQRPSAGRQGEAGELRQPRQQDSLLPPKEPAPAAPEWLRQVLLRGLQEDPAQRYPSMGHLLASLQKDPAVRKKRRLILVGSLVLAASAAAGIYRLGSQSSFRPCSDTSRPVRAVWNPEQRSSLQQAFAAAGLASGEEGVGSTWTRVSSRFDRWTQEWATIRSEACAATHVRGEQSADLLDRRMLCLDGQLADFRSLVTLLGQGEAQALSRAQEAAERLPALEPCSELESLRAAVPPPADDQARERLASARRGLAEARARLRTGQFGEGITLANDLLADTETLDYPPFRAQLLGTLGELQREAGDLTALDSLEEAVWASLASRQAETAVQAAGELGWVSAHGMGDVVAARRWMRLAHSAFASLGSPGHLQARLLRQDGMVAMQERRYDGAREMFKQALSRLQERLGERSLEAAFLHAYAATLDFEEERLAEAELGMRRGTEMLEALLGASDPRTATLRVNLGSVLVKAGQPQAAEDALRRSLTDLRNSVGLDHYMTMNALIELANLALERSRPEEALALGQEAREIAQRAFQDRTISAVLTMVQLGRCEQGLGRNEDAVQTLQLALQRLLSMDGAREREIVPTLTALASVSVALGRGPQAREYMDQARELLNAEAVAGGAEQEASSVGADQVSNASSGDRTRVPSSVVETAPPAIARQHAELLVLEARLLRSEGKNGEALARAQHAEELLTVVPQVSALLQAEVAKELALTLARLGRGEEAQANAERVLRWVEPWGQEAIEQRRNALSGVF